VDKLSEECYAEYLVKHQMLKDKEILNDDPIRDIIFHRWICSIAYRHYVNELYYRGWFENLMELMVEANYIIAEIEKKIDNYGEFIWEARVPRCSEICGIFILDVGKFIVNTVKSWVEREVGCYDRERVFNEIYKKFSVGTYEMI
jgi:hypothetical protein